MRSLPILLAAASSFQLTKAAIFCENNPSYSFTFNNASRDCDWLLSADQTTRSSVCSTNPAVEQACPFSCSVCCKDNPFYRLYVNNANLYSCSDIGNNTNFQYLYCELSGARNTRKVKDSCPEACGYCPAPLAVASVSTPVTQTSLPTSSPTNLPTNSPTFVPTIISRTSPTSSPTVSPTKCADNVDFTFKKIAGGEADCEWLGEKTARINRYCDDESIASECVVACGQCTTLSPPNPSPMSNEPTSSPIIQPSKSSTANTFYPTTYTYTKKSESPTSSIMKSFDDEEQDDDLIINKASSAEFDTMEKRDTKNKLIFIVVGSICSCLVILLGLVIFARKGFFSDDEDDESEANELNLLDEILNPVTNWISTFQRSNDSIDESFSTDSSYDEYDVSETEKYIGSCLN